MMVFGLRVAGIEPLLLSRVSDEGANNDIVLVIERKLMVGLWSNTKLTSSVVESLEAKRRRSLLTCSFNSLQTAQIRWIRPIQSSPRYAISAVWPFQKALAVPSECNVSFRADSHIHLFQASAFGHTLPMP